MKRTMRILGATAAVLLVGAMVMAVDAKTFGNTPGFDPKPIYFEAQLVPVMGNTAYGRATYQSKGVGEAYRFDAELLVPIAAFKAFGIDPEDGFEDEVVTAFVGKVEFKMTFGANEAKGALFTVTAFGTDLWPARGDVISVEVNAKEAANGKF